MLDMLLNRCMNLVVAIVESTRTSIATSKSGRQRTCCGFDCEGERGNLSAGGATPGLTAGRALGKIGKMVAGEQSSSTSGPKSVKNTPGGIRYGSRGLTWV